MKKNFNVIGMTCSSCSSNIEKTVSKLNGVNSVSVNLISNSMQLDYDEKVIKSQEVVKAVENIGYKISDENSKNETEKVNIELQNMKYRLMVSLIFFIPLFYLSMHHMLETYLNIPTPKFITNTFDGSNNIFILIFTEFILLLPIIFANQKYYINGLKSLIHKKPNMDSLIAIGSGAAIIYGIYALYKIGYGLSYNKLEVIIKFSKDIYFESAASILTLITLGKYLEAKSKNKTNDAISKLINLTPKTTIIIRNNIQLEIETKDILINDIIIIKPGMIIPVDGIIIEGTTSIDESPITGENMPIQKSINNNVISGTINKNGFIKFKATKVGNDTTLSQIIKLVEEASNSKAPISKLADKISSVFVPIVIIIALLATIIWIIIGADFEFALSIGISVLVISCPCALGLATPIAIMVGTGKGAENGILIKNAESLEILHSVDTIMLDKTGTITIGKPIVTDIIPLNNYKEKDILEIALTLEEKSEHPLSLSIIEYSKEKNIKSLKMDSFISISGKGIKGTISNKEYICGNLSLLENQVVEKEIINNLAKMGKTPICLANKKEVMGIIAVKDTIKKNSNQAIMELKKMGIHTIMLTGDNSITANIIKEEVNVDEVIAEVLPQDKENIIKNIQDNNKIVAMVGDGINDSPALTRASVGIAIGSGTDIAIESADIILLKNDLLDVVTSIKLSKNVINNIKMNLFWAFFYNTIGIPLAAGLFYPILGWKLSPMFGALAMSLSSLCVVANALRIKKFKINYRNEEIKLNTKIIMIEGMSCNHCTSTIEKVLSSIDGIVNVNVDLNKKCATIKYNNDINDEILINLITDKGFKVLEIEKEV